MSPATGPVSVATVDDMALAAATIVGVPVGLEILKDKPGRRRTARARGPAGSAIVKAYASARAPVVAARLRALQGGPPEPLVPDVLLVDPATRVVVLSDVAGNPLSSALRTGDVTTCRRAGEALAGWHEAWRGKPAPPLRPRTVDDELATLARTVAAGDAEIAAAVRDVAETVASPWPTSTVCHRDLYEEQILVGDQIGLIDLDDAAIGPPELDLGNLDAHVELFGRRAAIDVGHLRAALLDGYRAVASIDVERLAQCRGLSAIRLACIHDEPLLLRVHRVARPRTETRAWTAGTTRRPNRSSGTTRSSWSTRSIAPDVGPGATSTPTTTRDGSETANEPGGEPPLPAS